MSNYYIKYILLVIVIIYIITLKNTYEYLNDPNILEWHCDPNKPERCIKVPDGISPIGKTFSDTSNGDYGKKQECNEYCWNKVNNEENIINYNCCGRTCIIVEEGDAGWNENTNYLDVPNNLWGNKSRCDYDCQEEYPKYKCNKAFGTCGESEDGEYMSQEDCEDGCNKFDAFTCDTNTGTCISDDSGKYYAKGSCEEECGIDYTLYWILGGFGVGIIILCIIGISIYYYTNSLDTNSLDTNSLDTNS